MKNGRPPISAEKKALLFGAIADGIVICKAAKIAGINRNTATKYLSEFDGVPINFEEGDYLTHLEKFISSLRIQLASHQKALSTAKNTVHSLSSIVGAMTAHLSILEKIKDRAERNIPIN